MEVGYLHVLRNLPMDGLLVQQKETPVFPCDNLRTQQYIPPVVGGKA